MSTEVTEADRKALSSLALAVARPSSSMLRVRAAEWQRALLRIGVEVPLAFVHDLGLLAVVGPDRLGLSDPPLAAKLSPRSPESLAVSEWTSLVRELAKSSVVDRLRAMRLSDPMVAAIVARILGPIAAEVSDALRYDAPVPSPPSNPAVYEAFEASLATVEPSSLSPRELAFAARIADDRLRVVIAFEQLDLDTLRLLGMLGADAGEASSLSLLDLLSVFESAEANDVVNFSLDLLPSVLETKRARSMQRYEVDGYAGLTRRGSLDSLVSSELALPETIFLQRFADHELFYYAREKRNERDQQIHYVAIDATASMRGQRAVFARGLALALLKKLELADDEAVLRFFDARLYDATHIRPGRTGGSSIPVAHLLTFRGERGRNYGKVLAQLAKDVERLRDRSGREVAVYLVTHGQCHATAETIDSLRAVARVAGIFLLPSDGTGAPAWAGRLDEAHVVDVAALAGRAARTERALSIVKKAGSAR